MYQACQSLEKLRGKSIHDLVMPSKKMPSTPATPVMTAMFDLAQRTPDEGKLEMAPILHSAGKSENLALWRFSRDAKSPFYTVTIQRVRTALANPIVQRIINFESTINNTNNPEIIRKRLLYALREVSGAHAAVWLEHAR